MIDQHINSVLINDCLKVRGDTVKYRYFWVAVSQRFFTQLSISLATLSTVLIFLAIFHS